MSKEALKLALEALEEVKSWKSPTRWDGCFDKEIAAIKEALSSCQCPECQTALHASDCAVHNKPAYPNSECNCGAQPSVSVEQEPVAWLTEERYAQLHTAQRTWVGLTNEEIQSEWVLTPQNDKAEGIWFGRRIEAKLKEKNP